MYATRITHQHKKSLEMLILLYTQLEKGSNNLAIFTPALLEASIKRLTMGRELRIAMEEKQFEIYFQPIYDSRLNKFVGSESLIRWIKKDGTVVMPGEFLEVVKQTSLLIEIDNYVLSKSCRLIGLLGIQDNHRIAVNLSLEQLKDANFVKDCLDKYDIPPHNLLLELTEHIILENLPYIRETLLELRNMGVMLALDDFGTGYSPLVFLKQLPINVLKIDKLFVQDVEESQESQAIVRATISMAHSLGLQVVAEGVETDSQLTFMKNLSGDLIQGYYFSKPVKYNEFVAIMQKQTKIPI